MASSPRYRHSPWTVLQTRNNPERAAGREIGTIWSNFHFKTARRKTNISFLTEILLDCWAYTQMVMRNHVARCSPTVQIGAQQLDKPLLEKQGFDGPWSYPDRFPSPAEATSPPFFALWRSLTLPLASRSWRGRSCTPWLPQAHLVHTTALCVSSNSWALSPGKVRMQRYAVKTRREAKHLIHKLPLPLPCAIRPRILHDTTRHAVIARPGSRQVAVHRNVMSCHVMQRHPPFGKARCYCGSGWPSATAPSSSRNALSPPPTWYNSSVSPTPGWLCPDGVRKCSQAGLVPPGWAYHRNTALHYLCFHQNLRQPQPEGWIGIALRLEDESVHTIRCPGFPPICPHTGWWGLHQVHEEDRQASTLLTPSPWQSIANKIYQAVDTTFYQSITSNVSVLQNTGRGTAMEPSVYSKHRKKPTRLVGLVYVAEPDAFMWDIISALFYIPHARGLWTLIGNRTRPISFDAATGGVFPFSSLTAIALVDLGEPFLTLEPTPPCHQPLLLLARPGHSSRPFL